MRNIFIIGSKGIPGRYGGYESFVDNLTRFHQQEQNIKYHVACKSTEKGEFSYNNARCFKIKVPNIGPSQAIYYDVMALRDCCIYIKKNKIENPIVYILACRIGPFMKHYQKKIHKLGGELYLNPDGHEWLRAKWSKPVRRYWKISERMMVAHSDLVICDSKKMEKYILETYKKSSPKTVYISYGAETRQSIIKDDDEKLQSWYQENEVSSNSYYLIVGRLVPENNYETMICEFMRSNIEKKLILITDISNNYLNKLKKKTKFDKDARIKFVGPVYDKELLKKIRENAYAYIHGHEVGGTNPSLLESLGSTKINLLLDVEFNEEVAKDAGLYWKKDKGSLLALLKGADNLSKEQISDLGNKAKKRIEDEYNWQFIAGEYRNTFEEFRGSR
jgi:rhamnosyltransferase